MQNILENLSMIESLKLVVLKALDITRESLVEFRAIQPMSGERPPKATRIAYFVALIKSSNFNFPEWVVVRCKKTGRTFRANGQHTSGALASFLEGDFPKGLQARYAVFESEDVAEDMHRIFKIFDNKKSARGNGDCMANYAASYAELAGLSTSFLMNVANGINLNLRLQLEKNPQLPIVVFPSQDHGIYFMDKRHRDFALWVYRWVGTTLRKGKKVRIAHNEWMIGNAGIMAEMLNDWTALPEIANEFWDFVLKENHPEEDHLTHTLVEGLMDWRRALRPHELVDYMKKAAKEWKVYSRQRVAELGAQAAHNPATPPPGEAETTVPSGLPQILPQSLTEQAQVNL